MFTKESKMVGNSALNIPSELMQFVNRESYSLLIKGNAGTGKTVLALSILKILNIKENFQYISTRMSPSQMRDYYPELLNQFNSSKHSHTLDEENELEAPVFVDARLDEPSSMFERITNQLMDIGAPMIIIDTWDAISYFMDKETVMNNARVLQSWCERAKAKMIFISDNPNDTTFDVLVDGVVELGQRYHNDRLLRKITISKMRGVKINRPSYKFTLNNGLFRSFEPYNPSEFMSSVPKIQRNESSFDGSFIKSGNQDLDDAIGGGFPYKSITSVSLGPNVNWKVAVTLLDQIFSRFLANGNPILCRCSSIESSYITNRFKDTQRHSKTDLGFIFVNSQQQDAKTSKTNAFSEIIKKIKTKNPNQLTLNVVFSNPTHKITIQDLDDLQQFGNSTIIINSDFQEDMLSMLSRYADVSISLQEINGTLFAQSNIPWSHMYAVVMNKTKSGSHVELEPIV